METAFIHDTAAKIAVYLYALQLDAGWQYVPTHYDGELTRYASIRSEDGRALSFGPTQYPVKGRFSISGEYPTNAKGERVWLGSGVSQPSITVSPAKNPEAIAREIVRRLLPDYEAHLAKVRERIEQDNQHQDNLDNARRLLEAAGCSSLEWTQGELSLPKGFPGYGRAQLNGETVDLHLRSLPAPLAAAVLQFIQEQQAARKAA